MKKIFILLLTTTVLSACRKDQNSNLTSPYLKAIVINTQDISCYLPVIDFSEDSVQIRAFTKTSHLSYTIIGLDSLLNVNGKKIGVRVKQLQPEEEFPCNTLGLMYPRLKIVEAKEIE